GYYQNNNQAYQNPKPTMPFALWRSAYTSGPLGSLLIRKWNDTAWFDQNRPSSVAAARDYFKSALQAQKAALCAGKSLSRIEDFDIGPQSNPGQDSKGRGVGKSEAELGDPQQSSLEARFWIGHFRFVLKDFEVV